MVGKKLNSQWFDYNGLKSEIPNFDPKKKTILVLFRLGCQPSQALAYALQSWNSQNPDSCSNILLMASHSNREMEEYNAGNGKWGKLRRILKKNPISIPVKCVCSYSDTLSPQNSFGIACNLAEKWAHTNSYPTLFLISNTGFVEKTTSGFPIVETEDKGKKWLKSWVNQIQNK